MKVAVSTIRALVEGKLAKPWLYLRGDAGTFKTTLACLTLAEAIVEGGRGVYAPSGDIFASLYSAYSGGNGALNRKAITERLRSTPHLVLDDVGKEKASEHSAAVFFDVLDFRYQRDRSATAGQRWMILTSNLSIDGFASRFSAAGEDFAEPIHRRLSELAIEIPMVWAPA